MPSCRYFEQIQKYDRQVYDGHISWAAVMELESLLPPSVHSVLEDAFADQIGEGLGHHTSRGDEEGDDDNDNEHVDEE